ncbi:U-box domain and pentapeptide repeats domain containing protein [Orpheovirus IHUMI-LCC2]|uniref:U-box domain and pentapeptide repeats domain containing protein n=1 Tax=Orpheovirus IHUMI-LCC2 TaxID=2023057 RepID=A0A2I2L343_9VIRU|nr:U-box domain and pentapeptide repeats domain containing protein [Orpheovirus IHUMI-LCC2]SNW61958.1 U-box domain and pentapeptide repeats domain containing protein [Orpheovirus IHUMI-LCC2]
MEYVNLWGQNTPSHPNETLYYYPSENLDQLIMDPISLEPISDPVIYNNNIYDKKTIGKWLRISNLDPINGNSETSLDTIPFPSLKYIISKLEYDSDTGMYIFHSSPFSLLSYSIINNGNTYNIEDILYICPLSGNKYSPKNEWYITKLGHTISDFIYNLYGKKKTISHQYTEEILCTHSHNITILYKKIMEILGGGENSTYTIPTTFPPMSSQSYIRYISESEAVSSLQNIQCMMKTDSTIKKGLDKLQEITLNHYRCNKTLISNISDYRRAMDLPFIIQDIYKDFSLISLKNLVIRNACLKNYRFDGCDLSGCMFIDCQFINTSFINSKLGDVMFMDCTFTATSFYNSQTNSNTKYIKRQN